MREWGSTSYGRCRSCVFFAEASPVWYEDPVTYFRVLGMFAWFTIPSYFRQSNKHCNILLWYKTFAFPVRFPLSVVWVSERERYIPFLHTASHLFMHYITVTKFHLGFWLLRQQTRHMNAVFGTSPTPRSMNDLLGIASCVCFAHPSTEHTIMNVCIAALSYCQLLNSNQLNSHMSSVNSNKRPI